MAIGILCGWGVVDFARVLAAALSFAAIELAVALLALRAVVIPGGQTIWPVGLPWRIETILVLSRIAFRGD